MDRCDATRRKWNAHLSLQCSRDTSCHMPHATYHPHAACLKKVAQLFPRRNSSTRNVAGFDDSTSTSLSQSQWQWQWWWLWLVTVITSQTLLQLPLFRFWSASFDSLISHSSQHYLDLESEKIIYGLMKLPEDLQLWEVRDMHHF